MEAVPQGLAKPVDSRTPENFLSKVREKWPAYKDVPDDTLILKFSQKYPEYRDIAEKKFGSISDASIGSKHSQEYPMSSFGDMLKAGVKTYPDAAKAALEMNRDVVVRPTVASEALAISPGNKLEAAKKAFKNPESFSATDIESKSLNELGVKGGAQTALAGTLGTIMDVWPMIVDPAARMAISKNVKNGNLAAAEFHVKRFFGIPQETSLATVPIEELQASKKLGQSLRNNPEAKAAFATKVGAGTGEGQKAIESPSVISYVKDGKKIYTKITPEELGTLKNEVANIPAATNGNSQIHLDAKTASLEKIGKEVSRDEFIQGHPQAGGVLEPSAEMKTRGLSQGVEDKAIENKLTKGFGELPQYQVVNMKYQAAKASQLFTSNPDQARRIAMGEEPAPQGVIPEAVFIAVENKAIADGDTATLLKLAKSSKLPTEATVMGQRIRTLAERDPESPTGAIKDIISTREKVVEGRMKGRSIGDVKKAVAYQIKDEINKLKPKDTDWARFIASIKC